MQYVVLASSCLLLLAGCERAESPFAKQFTVALERPWPGNEAMTMTMTVLERNGVPILHCRLENGTANAIALNRSALPWRQSIYFVGTLVASTGETFPVGPPGILAYIVGTPDPFVLGAKDAIEAELGIEYLPPNPMVGPRPPKDLETIFLWSYDLPVYERLPASETSIFHEPPIHRIRLSGITYMPKSAMQLLKN